MKKSFKRISIKEMTMKFFYKKNGVPPKDTPKYFNGTDSHMKNHMNSHNCDCSSSCVYDQQNSGEKYV